MAYVKAATSTRARKFLATPEGRRQLLKVYLGTAEDSKPIQLPADGSSSDDKTKQGK